MKRPILQSNQGVVALEFLMMFLIFSVLAFGVVEFGARIHERNMITHLAREGASLYSRDIDTATAVVAIIKDASYSLDFENKPTDYALFVARATAGNPPVCVSTGGGGTLAEPEVVAPDTATNCGLTPALLAYLQQDGAGIAQMQQFSVVRIYYKHTPLTPLAGLLDNDLFGGGGGGGGIDPDPVMVATAIY